MILTSYCIFMSTSQSLLSEGRTRPLAHSPANVSSHPPTHPHAIPPAHYSVFSPHASLLLSRSSFHSFGLRRESYFARHASVTFPYHPFRRSTRRRSAPEVRRSPTAIKPVARPPARPPARSIARKPTATLSHCAENYDVETLLPSLCVSSNVMTASHLKSLHCVI